MKIRVNRATLSKRSSVTGVKDGFGFLFPGLYEAELTLNHELIFQCSATQKLYLPTDSILEKVNSGVITFIGTNDFDKYQSPQSAPLYK